MTNFEKIKQMSTEEAAEFIMNEYRLDCANCECYYDENSCKNCIKNHLESEAVIKYTILVAKLMPSGGEGRRCDIDCERNQAHK
ncbi:hypothetical protein [uncultured Ruminococcus sp.]|uniref:hypothetical protein n=1 Tax=uncultured Ruminococcus sp. TaxID=165186 RepID=UPI0025EDC94C|nr:hypothetical protein [uncultured Ruminococcus sp.]